MYCAGIKSTNNKSEFKDYLNEAISYMMTSLNAEIKKQHPEVDVSTIDYNDPKWKTIVDKMPYKPTMMGGLMNSLGLDEKVLTEDMWNDLFNGWIKTDLLPENSHLRAYAQETPKGSMVPLSNNPGKFDDKGEYVFDGERRPTNEALFTLGKGLSVWLVAKELTHPGTLKKVQDMHNLVMKQHVIPEMEKHARLRVRDEDEQIAEQDGYQIGVVSFMHIETRSLQPHIHFHDEILNSTMSKDGRLYSLTSDVIVKNKAMYDALYMSAMKEMMEREFNIEFESVILKRDENNEFLDDEEKNVVTYDISKNIVPEAMVEHYADRIAEIEESLREKGIQNTPEARAVEQKATREEKCDKSPSELLEMWRTEFAALGYSAEDLTGRVQPKKLNYVPVSDRQLAKNFVRKHYDQSTQRAKAAIRAYDPTEVVSEDVAEGVVRVGAKNKVYRKFIGAKFEQTLLRSFDSKTGTVDFRYEQFTAHIVKQALGTCTSATAWSEAERIAEEQLLSYLPRERDEYFRPFLEGRITDEKTLKRMQFEFQREARFITKDTKAQHDYIARTGAARANEDQWLVPAEVVAEEVMKYELEKGFRLSNDQLEDVRAGFNQPGAIVSTAGVAGSGKSTAAEVKVRILKRMGYNVIGTSIANTATKGLAAAAGLSDNSYFNSAKLIKMLDAGELVIPPKTVILFDEAGMADLHTMYKIIKHANEAGAKVNFLGEAQQLQPIGSSNMFKFLNENFVTRPLTTINRQKKEVDRENVMLWRSGNARKAMEDMYDRGNVIILKNAQEAFEYTANSYVENGRPVTDKIIMSSLNGDNDKINALIKQKLQERGDLDGTTAQVELKCDDGRKRQFGAGDRIAFFKNTETADTHETKVDNSDAGYVKRLIKADNGRVMAIELEMDRIDPITNKPEIRFVDVRLNPPAFRHAWSATIHKAQGASKGDAIQVLSHASHDAFNQYVAASRHKSSYKLVLTEEFIDEAIRRNKDKPVTEKQQAKLDWLRKETDIDVPDYAYESFGTAYKFLKKHVAVQMPGSENRTHPLDDYSDIIDMFSRQNYKKNVSDFVEVKDGLSMLKALEKERQEDITLFNRNKHKLAPVAKPETSYNKGKSKNEYPKSAKDIPLAPFAKPRSSIFKAVEKAQNEGRIQTNQTKAQQKRQKGLSL
jgi:conjugative relaxase-like TrwC/TraI family protein